MPTKKDVSESGRTFNNKDNSKVGKLVDSLNLLSQQNKKPTEEKIEEAKKYIKDKRVSDKHKNSLKELI